MDGVFRYPKFSSSRLQGRGENTIFNFKAQPACSAPKPEFLSIHKYNQLEEFCVMKTGGRGTDIAI